MPDTARTAYSGPGPSVLVTAAAGSLGREIVDRLLTHGARVRRLVRRPVEPLPGVESVVGDLTDRAVVRAALARVDAVVLMWPLLDAAPARPIVTELAEAAPRVLYVSSTAIADRAVAQSDPIVQTHADMEALLRGTGLRPVVLRSDTLAANVRGWAGQLRTGDVVTGPDIARTAVVDERDVAAAVTAALDTGPGDGPYLLTGPEPLGRADLVARLGAALGRPLRFAAVPAEVARARMLADGRPGALVDALVAASLHRPESTLVTDHVVRLTGRAASPFARWAVDHAMLFR